MGTHAVTPRASAPAVVLPLRAMLSGLEGLGQRVKINTGRATFGQLVTDPSMYRQGDSLVMQLRELVADAKANPKKYFSNRLF